MQQLTIFDELEESQIETLTRQGIIKNQVSIVYKGFHVANARDCRNGLYEVRPKPRYFNTSDLAIRTMDKREIEAFCEEHSFVKYEMNS